MLINSDGTIIRTAVDSISRLGRATQGVRLMRLDDAAVVAIALAEREDEDESAERETEE